MSLATINKSLGLSAPRLNELGKIKIGGLGQTRSSNSGGTYRSPVKYDHFVVTKMQRVGGKGDGDLVQDAALMNELLERHASDDGKLRELPIWLPTDELADVLQSSWVWYRSKTQLGARSDGEQVTWHCNGRTGEVLNEPVVSEWKESLAEMQFKGGPMFKLNTVLNCMILSREARVAGGIYKFRTTSRITYERLYASLTDIAKTTGGVLRNIPLVLVVDPVQVKPQGKASTVYAVRIELRGTDIRAIQEKALEERRWRIENKVQAERLEGEYRKLLMAPGTEKGQELSDVVQEFYPETARAIPTAPAEHIDLVDGLLDDAGPAEPGRPPDDPSSAPPGHDPDAIDVEYTDGPTDPLDDPATKFEADEDAAYAAWRDGQEKPVGTDILDDVGVEPRAPAPAPREPTTAERELTTAALERDPRSRPVVTAASTYDEFLAFVVEHRPRLLSGKASEPLGALTTAERQMKLFLAKPWAKQTAAQRDEAIAKVKAGRFPWPGQKAK